MEQTKRIAMRFLRGFLAGGLASVATFLSAGVNVTDIEGIKALSFALGTSFVAGGILALDKLVREILSDQESQ